MKRGKQGDFALFQAIVPQAAPWTIDWPTIWKLVPDFAALDECPQDSNYHAEGDAGTHTRMVVEALVTLSGWQKLPPIERSILFWAACFHDIGKPGTTKYEEDGKITSRGHSKLGASITRDILRNIEADFYWREAVCGIILMHQLPFWLVERDNPERLAIETSLICKPQLLCLHAEADALGRICEDQSSILDNIALAKEVFLEMGCLADTFNFANDESRLCFLNRDDRDPYYHAHEEFSCTAYVMSALPGSGKDTWITRNQPDLPMVSLDIIREEIGISAEGNQGRVIQAAYEKAKSYLRTGTDFIWNATNITEQTRGKVLRLLRDYNARIHIVYLEVPPWELTKQNNLRAEPVPSRVIENLARKLEPPTLSECHDLTHVLSIKVGVILG